LKHNFPPKEIQFNSFIETSLNSSKYFFFVCGKGNEITAATDVTIYCFLFPKVMKNQKLPSMSAIKDQYNRSILQKKVL
jgi:hypothetical protein